MTREEHLKFCKVCQNRKFDRDKGIVCGLTNEIADFEDECSDYQEDTKTIKEEVEKTKEQLKDNSLRASLVIKIFWGIMIINLVAIVSGYLELELLERAKDGAYISDEEANMNDLRQGVVGIFQSVLYIASIITFLNWFRRAYGNLHRINSAPEYKEEMAIWAFFIPFVNLYRPFQIAKEILRHTGQKLLEIDKNVKFSTSTATLGLWWALYLITNFIGNIIFKMVLRGGETLNDLISQSQAYLLSDALDIPAAFVTLLVIKKISKVETLLFQKVSS